MKKEEVSVSIQRLEKKIDYLFNLQMEYIKAILDRNEVDKEKSDDWVNKANKEYYGTDTTETKK